MVTGFKPRYVKWEKLEATQLFRQSANSKEVTNWKNRQLREETKLIGVWLVSTRLLKKKEQFSGYVVTLLGGEERKRVTVALRNSKDTKSGSREIKGSYKGNGIAAAIA